MAKQLFDTAKHLFDTAKQLFDTAKQLFDTARQVFDTAEMGPVEGLGEHQAAEKCLVRALLLQASV